MIERSPRYRRIWLLLGWGMVAAVTVLSLIPLEVDLGEGRDKIAHFVAYGSLSFWFAIMFGGRSRQLAIAIAFAGMGVAIEYLQRMTGYRSFDIDDMVANAIGAGYEVKEHGPRRIAFSKYQAFAWPSSRRVTFELLEEENDIYFLVYQFKAVPQVTLRSNRDFLR